MVKRAVLIALSAATMLLAEQGATIQKMEIGIDEKFFVKYNGAFKSSFPKGFEIGIGSGMALKSVKPDGTIELYVISDRGPNADSPKLVSSDSKFDTKIFPSPNFTPSIGVVEVKDGSAKLVSLTTLKVNNKPISGRPLPNDRVGSTKEVAFSDSLNVLQPDINGLDTEGIDFDKIDGHLWICDEYGPFIAKVDRKTGNVIKKYTPGDGLPEVIKHRIPNRGFEALAVTPNNKVYAMVQSILDVDGDVKKSKAEFTRIVELDPATGKTRIFAYPHDLADYKASRDAKMGDMVAISNTKFLVVEQGADKKKKMQNKIYMIDLEKATDISGMKTKDGKELESAKFSELKGLGVRMAPKRLVADLKELGWKAEKAEGLAILEDYRTLIVMSDNDFGMGVKLHNPAKDKDGKDVKDPTDYTINDKKELLYDNTKVDTKIEVTPSGEKAEFWVLKLPKSVLDY